METFYLVDFENVNNKKLKNIDSLSKEDHVYIFTTKNAINIRMDIVFSKGIDIQGHIVPEGKQSLDKHLVSYLGYLLGVHGKQCSCIIISGDTGYDNIIKFWKEEGYPNISRLQKIPGGAAAQKKADQQTAAQKKAATQTATAVQTANSKISAGMAYDFSGEDRTILNEFVQHELIGMGYSGNDANRICKYVVSHCNDEQMLSAIHNDLKKEYDNCSKVYEDVKSVLGKFVTFKSKTAKRESQVRSFFGQHFKEKIYVDNKEAVIDIIVNAKTRQQVNNELLKLYSDNNIVKCIYQTVQPLIKDLPGK